MQDQPNNKQVRFKCPKGLKMAKSVKTIAALIGFANQSDRNSFARKTAAAQHEAAIKAKEMKRSQPRTGAPTPAQ